MKEELKQAIEDRENNLFEAVAYWTQEYFKRVEDIEKTKAFELGINVVLQIPSILRHADPEIMKQAGWAREEEWTEVLDSEKFFNEFYDKHVTVLCPIYNTATKKMSWEMYHAEIDNDGELFYVDGSGDCGVTYKDVSFYRVEKFPPLPQPPKQ